MPSIVKIMPNLKGTETKLSQEVYTPLEVGFLYMM